MTEGTNGLDKEAAQAFVDQIERHMSDLLSERGSYMARCRGIREAITGVYDDAKGKGIRRNSLKTLIKERGLERRIIELREALEADDKDNYELLVDAVAGMEGTPLGDAAVEMNRREGRGRRVRKATAARRGSALDKLDTATDPRPAA
jgi:hypothetical protein